MSVWTTKTQFPCLWTDYNHFFSFNWKIFTWNNCIIIINFGIMILCEINFDKIWYSVIFAANQYLSIFVWSFDILNFVFMNDVILVIMKMLIISKSIWTTFVIILILLADSFFSKEQKFVYIISLFFTKVLIATKFYTVCTSCLLVNTYQSSETRSLLDTHQ